MESSSTSKGPIVAKILIDLSEYKTLKEAKRFQEEHEKKLTEHYEEKVTGGEQQGDLVDHLDQQGEGLELRRKGSSQYAPPLQVGLGVSDLKDIIVSAIAEGFKDILQNQVQHFIQPQAGGSSLPLANLNDLVPAAPVPSSLENAAPITGPEEVLIKSDKNDQADENILLKKISPKFRERAAKLIQGFDDYASIMSWDSNGVLFIDGNSIANSNIFELMPELFKPNPDKSKPGFKELVKKLAALGFGNLINRTILKGLQRAEQIDNQLELYNYIHKNPNKWYFIGK